MIKQKFFNDIVSICKDLQLAVPTTLEESCVYDIDTRDEKSISNFKRFISDYSIKKMMYVDTKVLETHFKGLGKMEQLDKTILLRLFNCPRLAVTNRGDFVLYLE